MLLGIDEGTSAVKAVLFDDDLTPIREARREKRTLHPRPGWVEQDAEEILDAVVSAATEALGSECADAVGLDHQGESVVAWDPVSGRPLSAVVTWQDKRGAALLDGVDVSRTGLPADPYFSASKIAWLLGEGGVPPTARIGTVDSFLCDRLGAGFATDPSTASRTLLNVPGDPGWDPDLLQAFGVPPAVLPRIEDTCGELGELRGIGPLRARCCDQQAALAGAGCVREGMVKATYGTGVFVLTHAGTSAPSAPGLLPTVAWRAGGRVEFALDGGVFTAGALVDWLAELFGVDAGALLAGAASDAGGVRILPALAGIGAPWWRPEATGVIGGLTRGSGRAELARAALEGIAWRVADVLAVVGAAELRVDGGLTRSDTLLQLQADFAGVTVRRTSPDATVRGAAALAAVGAGLLPDTAAIAALTPAGPAIEPQTDAPWRQEAHAAWRRFVQASSSGG
ncbi:MAG: glycerol kinase [Solirubrobacteraceae bacterium]|nr:glycerol kinase [Solirubrobacteraceae bacterium]